MTPSFSDENYYLEEEEESFEVENEVSLTNKLDVYSNEFVGTTDNLEALVQHIKVLMNIERYQHEQIFDDSVGLQTADLIGQEQDYVEGELQLRIEEMLLCDDRIESVSDFEISYPKKGSLYIKFQVHSIFGDTEIETERSDV